MKKTFRSLIRQFLNLGIGRFFAIQISRFNEYLRYEKSLHERELAEKKLKSVFKDLKVKQGPFSGLIYTSFISIGSSIFPKLHGSYESELHPVFQSLKSKNYSKIIDIGCAEGYYVVGLARLFPYAQLIAFDIDSSARTLCREMAEANQVSDRVEILNVCTEDWLTNTPIPNSTLFIVDCEGCEANLFTNKSVRNLAYSDLIIELHPMHEKEVKEKLMEIFSITHKIQIISSYDDARKIFDLNSEFTGLSEVEKVMLVQEGRPFCMDWLILTSKGSI